MLHAAFCRRSERIFHLTSRTRPPAGNTERIAGYIGDATGISPTPIADVSAADLEAADCIICGAPTWNTGADDMRSGAQCGVRTRPPRHRPRAVAATRRNHRQHAVDAILHTGTDIDDWLYSELPNADLSGKKVALFGLGDSAGYSGNFCDSVGELYDCFTARGATVVGFTDQDGYDHYDSKAIRDDKFCGLMCDEQNQMDQSEDRATAWVEQLKAEGMPL